MSTLEPRRRGASLEYVCDACGRAAHAGPFGCPPLSWTVTPKGHACSEFCAARLKTGGTVPNLPTKIVAEYYLPGKSPQERRRLLYKYTIVDFKSYDDALRRARERAAADGKRVVSANFRAGEESLLESIVVYVEPEVKT